MFGPDLGGLPVAASLLRVDPPGSPLPRAELVVEEEVVRDGVPDGEPGGQNDSGGQDGLGMIAKALNTTIQHETQLLCQLMVNNLI